MVIVVIESVDAFIPQDAKGGLPQRFVVLCEKRVTNLFATTTLQHYPRGIPALPAWRVLLQFVYLLTQFAPTATKERRPFTLNPIDCASQQMHNRIVKRDFMAGIGNAVIQWIIPQMAGKVNLSL